jgi:hypothetical protein
MTPSSDMNVLATSFLTASPWSRLAVKRRESAPRLIAPSETWEGASGATAHVEQVTAAAVTTPDMAAWQALLWRGQLEPGQTALVPGAQAPRAKSAFS